MRHKLTHKNLVESHSNIPHKMIDKNDVNRHNEHCSDWRWPMKVKRNTLLLIACLVWCAAGFNIFRIGFLAYRFYITIWNLLLSGVVFTVFQKFIFGKLVKKHSERIKNYPEERQFFMKFFDVKSFFIMAFMMTGGIGIRMSGIAPERFIAVFYSGLGASLFLAGILFGRNYGRAIFNAATVQNNIKNKGQ